MKKMILAAAIVAASAFTMAAQEESYAPQAGKLAVELQFNPFSNNYSTFRLGDNQLKVKYNITDNDAVRLGIGFGVDNNKTTADPKNDKDAWTKVDQTGFSINLGYQRQLVNYGRLNLYAGIDLGYAMSKGDNVKSFKDSKDVVREETTYNANNYNEFNAAVFTGVDFHIYKGLFVGAELGLKLATQKYPGSYTKGGINDKGEWSDSYESDKQNEKSTFSFKTFATPALRLGWTF